MGRKKSYEREKILYQIMETFWMKGYHGTSLSDLVETTGLNKKSLYSDFGDKFKVFAEALSLCTQMGLSQAVSFLQKEPLGLSNVKSYFLSMSYEPDCRGCLMTITINQKQLVEDHHLSLVSSTLKNIEELLFDNLVASGKPKTEATKLSTFLVFLIQGITTMGKLEGDNRRLEHTISTALSILDSSSDSIQ